MAVCTKLSKYLEDASNAVISVKHDLVLQEEIERCIAVCISALQSSGKILVAGNGGSAGDAQHFVGELVGRFFHERPALSAIALTTNTSILTAIANDYSYEEIFSRQIQALGRSGDVLIAISTSGNSSNIIKAIRQAKSQGLVVIGLTGLDGGMMLGICDICLQAPSNITPHIQECHLIIEHAVCAGIEDALFGDLSQA